uniref:Uncharacterized protein n=1 Tax=Thermogemmatispora argillosa TaxID=2045280 RepID=A0A455T0A7_9CHLR|nr:hypothetical protein KTA_14770 [Thermogemmatispora argillosa]
MEQERSYWLLAAMAETNVPRDAADPRRWERWHEGCELVIARPLERERLERLLAWEEQGQGGEEEPLEFAVPARALRLDYVPLPLELGGGEGWRRRGCRGCWRITGWGIGCIGRG